MRVDTSSYYDYGNYVGACPEGSLRKITIIYLGPIIAKYESNAVNITQFTARRVYVVVV